MFLAAHSFHVLGLMQKELVNPLSLFMIVEHQSFVNNIRQALNAYRTH